MITHLKQLRQNACDFLRGRVDVSLLCNALLLLCCYMLCRMLFLAVNHEEFQAVTVQGLKALLRGGVRFDWAAVCYTNALYLLLLLCPLHWKENLLWQQVLKGVFVVTNALCLLLCLLDVAFYAHVGRHLTASIFWAGTTDWAAIGWELFCHSYLLIPYAGMVWGLWKLYRMTAPVEYDSLRRYYLTGGAKVMVAVWVVVLSVRGLQGAPLSSTDAVAYTHAPAEASLVLNAPYTVCRTMKKRPYIAPTKRSDLLPSAVSPTPPLYPATGKPWEGRRANVVVIFLDGVGNGHSAFFGKTLDCTPFLDSLAKAGRTYEHTFGNGQTLTDAQVAVWASIPTMVESFFDSHAGMSELTTLPNLLKTRGYTAITQSKTNKRPTPCLRLLGFDHCRETLTGELPEPFVANVTLSASAQTVKTADDALRNFFANARKQPWYERTLFVVAGTGKGGEAFGETGDDVPLLFFHPSDKKMRGTTPGIAQHIDVMPTVLNYLGYNKAYIAFGRDLFRSASKQAFAIGCHDGTFHYRKGNLLLLSDGTNPIALYDFVHDPQLTQNLLHQRFPLKQQEMEAELNDFLCQYMTRMNENRLTVRREKTGN